MIKLQPRQQLRFNTHLTDHCNLNCIGCGHFSPIAEKKFLEPDVFERDCKRLSELTQRNIERIELMGGEPLLHPQVNDIIYIARTHFDGQITIVTNGTLLLKQKDKFWKVCRDNNIEIEMTAYPIKVGIEEINLIAKQNGVIFRVYGRGINDQKYWFHNKRDLRGNQNINSNFEICKWANSCIYLEDGKLSTCVVPALIKHFNAYFGDTFKVSENDYIDIYKAKDLEEILSFLSKPIPFCRYCLPREEKIIKWNMSKNNINEWI